MRLLVKQAVRALEGELVIPSSKYHAHRALILASLAPGTSRIEGLSDAGHVRYTIQALRRLGTKIAIDGDTFIVHGGPYQPSRPDVSVGSSGTTLYFLTGLASLATAPVTIVGQKYFQRRPIGPLLQALSGLGVELSSPDGCPPIAVQPRRPTGGQVSIAGTLVAVDLRPAAAGPVRHRPQRHHRGRRSQRAHLHRPDHPDDGPVRPARAGQRRLVPLRDRGPTSRPARPRSRCRRTSARPRSGWPSPRCTPRT